MDGSNVATDLRVELTMNEATAKALRQYGGEVAVAEALEIDSPEAAEYASGELKRIAQHKKSLKAFYDGFVEPAKKIIENAKSFFSPADAALTQADLIIRAKLTAWTTEQERIAAEQRRQREEAERKARQEANERAAAATAKAQEEAAALQRQAEEAEQRRQQALASGDTRGAAKAAATVASLTEKAASTIENGEAKAQEVQIATMAAVPEVEVTSSKTKGFTLKDNWELEPITDPRESLLALCSAVINDKRMDLLAYLSYDQSALNKTAKAMKDQTMIPGFKPVNNRVSARTR